MLNLLKFLLRYFTKINFHRAHKTTNQEETDKKLITPVRRSARLSRSYTQPNKEVFNSVGEAQDSFQGDVVFKGNSALASKYAL